MSEDRKDITFEVEVEDVPADEQIPADEQVSEGEGAYPDNIDEVKEELAKAAERVAGSIGHLAAKKGEEIADSIDEFNENTSIKNLFERRTMAKVPTMIMPTIRTKAAFPAAQYS